MRADTKFATAAVIVCAASVSVFASGEAISNGLGTASLPSYAFFGDSNTGMYSAGADNVSFATAGGQRLQVRNGDVVSSVRIGGKSGSVSDLSMVPYQVDTDTGLWVASGSANALGFATGGVQALLIDSSQRLVGTTFGGWSALDGVATSTNFATLTTRNLHRVLEYDAATDESTVFGDTALGVMSPHYGGGTITVKIYWLAATATSGDCIWNVAWERHEDDNFDLDGDGFAAVQAVTDTAASLSGEVSVASVTFTQAQADSIAAGESFRLKVTRDADNVSDNMAGDAQLLRVTYEE